nr:hypothetical protein [Hymenobacter terricola]
MTAATVAAMATAGATSRVIGPIKKKNGGPIGSPFFFFIGPAVSLLLAVPVRPSRFRGRGRLGPQLVAAQQLGDIKYCGIAAHAGHGRDAARQHVECQKILLRDLALVNDFVPLLGVAGVAQALAKLLRPEEGSTGEGGILAQHVAGDRLAVLLGQPPVLDAGRLTGAGHGKPGNIAGGIHMGRRLQVGIHRQSAVLFELESVAQEIGGRAHAHAQHHRLGRQGLAGFQLPPRDVAICPE